MTNNRATRKSAKTGQLRMFYGRLPGESAPDICSAWGDGCSSRDSRLLHWVMCSKRAPINPGEPWLDSLLDELKARGYDLSTLEFSIMKKPIASDEPCSHPHCGTPTQPGPCAFDACPRK